MIKKLVLALILLMNISAHTEDVYHRGWNDLNKNGKMDPYENPHRRIEKRIEDLLERMTIEEKTCQMATLYGYGNVLEDELPTDEWKRRIWKDGIANMDEHLNGETPGDNILPPSKHTRAMNKVQKFFIEETRLGIPVDFSNEGTRGLRHMGATSFPCQIGIGSTWDVNLASRIGHVVGREAKVLGYTNVYTPIMDLARDPRWGRTVECFSEDPFLVSRFGIAQVKALQDEDVVSTLKHFAVHGIPKGGRDGGTTTDPKAPLWEVEVIHLAPFRASIKQGGAMGVMTAHNDYDGIPMVASRYFMTDILEEQWDFRGYRICDSGDIEHIHTGRHKVAPTFKDGVRQAVKAGLNVRCAFNEPENYIEPLRELVREGTIPIEMIDERVEDVLRVKFWLGLFDHPYVENPDIADSIVHCNAHRELSLEAARKSIVLLKNEDNLLPLDKDIKSILITGPNAKATEELLYMYGPMGVDVKSIFEGISDVVSPQTEIKYTKGCNIIDERFPESDIYYESPGYSVKKEIERAAELAEEVNVAIVAVGETHGIVGEDRSRVSLNLPGYQRDLIRAIHETGTPTVVVLMNGRPLSINWVNKHIPAVIEAWFPGEFGGQAVAEVLFGDFNPGGKLSITFPKSAGQIPMNFPHKKNSQAGNHSRVSGVLYPFGHGLSYTDFEYSDLEIEPGEQESDGNIDISLKVKNTGEVRGDEVVQLYLRDEFSSVTHFEKFLRGFERITLNPGEERRVTFTITPEDIQLLNRDMEWVVEPGDFTVMVGSSSEDIRLKGNFKIVE